MGEGAGDFCDGLTAAIVHGEKHFRQIRGTRADTDKYRSTLTISGASFCYVDDLLSRYDSRLVCRFFDGGYDERNLAMLKYRELENEIRACLILEDRFEYGYDDEGIDEVRYREYEFGNRAKTWFSDRHHRDQDVDTYVDCDDTSCSVYVEIESR